jgi:hypothetical protein
MQIEITEKEKTALSILLGLRQKFAKEKNETYSANELHKLFSELLLKINRQELRLMDTIQQINTPTKPRDEIWGEIDEAIERSKIKRYDWEKVFGRSLTQEILLLKKQGLDVKQTYNTLLRDPRVQAFITENKKESKKILDNLTISIHERFGENNTAQKVMEGTSQ